MSSWVSVLVQAASSDSGWSGFGGHALIAIKCGDTYEVFHLVGARNSSSGTGHAIYNSHTSIERYRCEPNGKAVSCGGRSGRNIDHAKSFKEVIPHDTSKWYSTHLNNKLNIRETPRLSISKKIAKKIIDHCITLSRSADVSQTVGTFSLIGGQLNMGTNCISWAYSVLKKHGVTFDWRLYAMSFVSPRKAIESGGGLQYA
ncbi:MULTISPECIES: hypothetical protein [Azotobacter]|uniref:hypothetical protein n=1 Tax=Azotobacter TaxID=352 RepID=UPI000920177A|nr:hypothetical protein [Azotobacter vinelandii]WKN21920.1 hypothetical protein AVAEIV_005046 [Azotobacter vinelandii]SFX65670.1 hypothetical protein SAMN04244547_02297 [Azotobacter vinelandii]